jgi:hypothetical protein
VAVGKKTYKLNLKELELQVKGLHYKSGRQIIRQIPSEVSAVWQPKEVYYEIIWMCAEASTIVGAVAADFFFDC